MRKGQIQIFYETIIGLVLLVIISFFLGLGGEISTQESERMIKDTLFVQHFDNYFLTFLQTPVPKSTLIPGYSQSKYAYLDKEEYVMGDLLFQAVEDEENKEKYLETFRHYLYVTYNAATKDSELSNGVHRLIVKYTFPDGSLHYMGDLVHWRDREAKTSYVLPYKKDQKIIIEATGWLT